MLSCQTSLHLFIFFFFWEQHGLTGAWVLAEATLSLLLFPPAVVFISTKWRASLPVCPHSNCPTKRAHEQISKPKLTQWWRSRAADLYGGTSNDHVVLKTYVFLQCVLDFGGMAWFYMNTLASKVQQIMMLLMEQIDHIP